MNTRVAFEFMWASVLDMNNSGWRQQLIAPHVTQHMNAAGISTIKELSSRSGVGRTIVTQVLGGTREPTGKVIGAIAGALNVHPAQIATWEHIR